MTFQKRLLIDTYRCFQVLSFSPYALFKRIARNTEQAILCRKGLSLLCHNAKGYYTRIHFSYTLYRWKHYVINRNRWSCITLITYWWCRLCGKNYELRMNPTSWTTINACLAGKHNAFNSHHCLIANESQCRLNWGALKQVSDRMNSRSPCTYKHLVVVLPESPE